MSKIINEIIILQLVFSHLFRYALAELALQIEMLVYLRNAILVEEILKGEVEYYQWLEIERI